MDRKSILIIDKPKCCDECDISLYDKDKQEIYCPFVAFMNFELGKMGIHEDCPLKDMPVREPQNDYNFENYKNGIAVGWNDCVDYLLGKGRWERTVANDGKAEETTMC